MSAGLSRPVPRQIQEPVVLTLAICGTILLQERPYAGPHFHRSGEIGLCDDPPPFIDKMEFP